MPRLVLPVSLIWKRLTDWVLIYMNKTPSWRTISTHYGLSVRALWSVSTLINRLKQQTKAILSSSAFSPQPSNSFDVIMWDFILVSHLSSPLQFVRDWKWPPLLTFVYNLCIYVYNWMWTLFNMLLSGIVNTVL